MHRRIHRTNSTQSLRFAPDLAAAVHLGLRCGGLVWSYLLAVARRGMLQEVDTLMAQHRKQSKEQPQPQRVALADEL